MSRLRFIALVAIAAVIVPAAHSQEEAQFRAGAATSNITPWLGVSIAGHMRDRKAQDIHDELHVRCLALDDGDTKLAFAIVDSCMVPRGVFDNAKSAIEAQTGISASHMLMAATHTHSAACATPVFQSDPDPEYNRFLTSRIADGVIRALNNLEPARIAWGVGDLPGEVFNRRWYMKEGTIPPNPFGDQDKVKMNPPRGSEDLIEPAGPIDPEVPFIAIQSPGGRPIALLANYSLHYVGGTAGPEISADYFAIFANRIEQLINAEHQDPRFVAMLTNGTSGDINNINFQEASKSQQPYEQMTHVANRLADEVYRVYQGLEYRDYVELDAAQTEIDLGVRLPSPEDITDAKSIMAEAEGPEMKSLPEIYARETVLLAEYPETVPVILQALRIGDLAITAIPCEVFVEIGLEIKEESPFDTTFTVELANGYNGYLPTAKHHELGGYETWRARSSYLEVNAARKITDTVLELTNELSTR